MCEMVSWDDQYMSREHWERPCWGENYTIRVGKDREDESRREDKVNGTGNAVGDVRRKERHTSRGN